MNRQENGFSLVELMIAMVLGLLLLTGAGNLFLATNKTWTLQDELARIQENARLAMELLGNSIRTAAYTGCPPQADLANIIHTGTDNRQWMAHFDKGILGFSAESVKTHVDSSAISDAIIVHSIDRSNAVPVINHDVSTATVVLLDSHDYHSGDLLALISRDCQQISLFRAGLDSEGDRITHPSAVGGNLFNCTDELKGHFNCHGSTASAGTMAHTESELAPLDSQAFYLRTSNGVPTLYRKPAGEYASGRTQNAEALVEGIENIHILYGLDSDGDGIANQYQTTGVLGLLSDDWHRVVSVKLELLARSFLEVAPEAQPYFFAGQKVVPDDLFIRRNYVTTIQLRNRN